MATDDAAGYGAPVPVCRLWTCVASGHQQGGGGTGQDLPGAGCRGRGIVVAHLSMARVAPGPAVAWDTANTAVITTHVGAVN